MLLRCAVVCAKRTLMAGVRPLAILDQLNYESLPNSLSERHIVSEVYNTDDGEYA